MAAHFSLKKVKMTATRKNTAEKQAVGASYHRAVDVSDARELIPADCSKSPKR